jgi:hypothetical protein
MKKNKETLEEEWDYKIKYGYQLTKSQYNKLSRGTKSILACLDIKNGEIIICGQDRGRLSLHRVLNGELTEIIQRVLDKYVEMGNDTISSFYLVYLQISAICGEGGGGSI